MHLNSILLTLPAIAGHFQHVRAASSCFAANGNSPTANFDACCSGQSSGTEHIGNTKYVFKCDTSGNKNSRGPLGAKSALACAQFCNNDPSCVSSTWLSEQGHCYWSDKVGTGRSDRDTQKYMWLVKSGTDDNVPDPGPEPDCQQKVAVAVQKEKQTCARSLSELKGKHSAAIRSCEKRNQELEDQLREGMTQPKREWKLLSGNLKHDDEARSVAFSPDGKILASGSSDGQVNFWDMENSGSLHQWNDDGAEISSVVFSPDGKQLLAADALEGNVFLFDVQTGRKVEEFTGHTEDVNSVAFSPDGLRFASGSTDNTVRLWDLSTKASHELTGHTDNVLSVAFSSDGKYLASGSKDRTIRIWDGKTGAFVRSITGHSGQVRAVAFPRYGFSNLLASGSNDKLVKLWNVDTGSLERDIPHPDTVVGLSFSPDNRQLASTSYDKHIRLLSLNQGDDIDFYHGAINSNAVAFSPKGTNYVASAFVDGSIKVWTSA